MNQAGFRIAVFLSGAAGLLLQTLWVRLLGFIFGNTTIAVSLVLASFFFGMALGSRFFGKRADVTPSPFRFYARLELGIGLTAAIAWFALRALEPVYVWFYRYSDGNLASTRIVQLVLTFAVLSIPTILMGATLPAMVRCVMGDERAIATSVGRIYALNAIGAAAGLVAGAFILIEILGLSGCYALAISLNVAAAVLAAISRGTLAALSPAASTGDVDEKPVSRWLYALAFVTGMLGIGYEVLWIRLWSFVSLHSVDNPIGRAPAEMSSTYVFSFIVLLVVAGIAIGGALVKYVRRPERSHLEDLAMVQAALGIWGLVTVTIEPLLFFDHLQSKLIEVTLLVLPMSILMGIGFPLLAAEFVKRTEGSGERFGRFYSVNTLGSCIGPIAAGLVLLPLRGTYASLTLFAVANLVIAAILIAVVRTPAGVRRTAIFGAVVLLVALVVPFPTMTRFTAPDAPKVIFEEDNSVAHTLVLDSGKRSRWLVVNNHMVSGLDPQHAFGRASIQIPTALLGRAPKDILVLCVGTGGSWAGTLRYDANVVAVDINPAVFRALPLLHPADRYRLMNAPNRTPVVGDARNFLLLDDRRYDVINIDPAPPITQPGMVNLHTVEFYRLAKARLKPGGVLIQRFSGEPDSEAFYPELLKSIADVFPEVTVWSFLRTGLDVIASDRPLTTFHTNPALIEPVIAAYAPRAFVFGRQDVDRYVEGARSITDDRPILEYNILSRFREDRFDEARERNLQRLRELRKPFGDSIRIAE
jgi:spermidine synthase